MKKNKIESVRIEKVVDDSPDTSYIGEYTDKKTDWAICRHCGEYVAIAEQPNEDNIYQSESEEDAISLHDCPYWNREYNYFLPYASGEKPGSADYQTYGMQDYKRMERLNSGDWYFIGIIAKAVIVTTNGTMQTIRSGGLWGIESDSGSYINEIAKEQLDDLRNELTALGFGKRQIDYAFKNVENED